MGCVTPAVLTSISSSFIMTFRYRDKFVIFTIANERLKLAQLRFKAESSSPTDDALLHYLDRVELIINWARDQWREVNLSGWLPMSAGRQLRHIRNPDDDK